MCQPSKMEKLIMIKHSKFPVLLVLVSFVTVASAGLGLRLPITIPFLTFQRPHHHGRGHPHPHNHPQHQQQQQNHHALKHHHNHHAHHDPLQSHSHHYLNHAHIDEQGRYYLHDPDSTVKFYYKEYLNGPSNRVDIHDDGCRDVPMDYWYNRPKSLWAKHCITLYQSGHCKGEGVQVAGMVSELRSVGMHYGVNSFKPCEKNIRIRFMPPVKHHHHHHHHQPQHKHHLHAETTKIQQIQLR